MLDENTAQESNESVQEEQTIDTDSSMDYKGLYLTEVQNAKKLRKRAQDSEVMIQDFRKNEESQKIKGMKDQKKYKELSEELQIKLNEISPYKEKWDSHESTRRELLLSKLPEADRERMSSKDIDTLEYIVSKLSGIKPPTQEPVPGISRNMTEGPDKDIFALEPNERKKYWDNYMDNIMYNKKKN